MVGPEADKPVVFDDTCYFVACTSRAEAELVAALLGSDIAAEFLAAFVFWDAKRPITVEVLRRLSLSALARQLGMEEMLTRLPGSWRREGCSGQGDLFTGQSAS